MKLILGVAIALLPKVLFAEPVIERSSVSQSDTHQSEVLPVLAKKWNITVQEYQQYTELMKGPLRFWNPNIDPVLALGIYAESEAEQQRYAALYAQQEYRLLTRTQAFERAYHKAFTRLYPNAEVIEDAHMQPYYQHQANKQDRSAFDRLTSKLLSKDRILYFVELDCVDCESDIQKLVAIQQQHPTIFVDFYVRHVNTENDVRRWAAKQEIDGKQVKQGRITLNVDVDTYDKLAQRSGKRTRFYLSRGKDVYAIDAMDIYLQ